MEKKKKKTLTISSSFSKTLSPDSYGTSKKKSYLIEKKKSSFKKPFKTTKNWSSQPGTKSKPASKNVNRKHAEQQATKRFIHSEKKNFDNTKEKTPIFSRSRASSINSVALMAVLP